MAARVMAEAIGQAKQQCSARALAGAGSTHCHSGRQYGTIKGASQSHLKLTGGAADRKGFLASKTLKERRLTNGMQAKRAPVMLAGTILLCKLMKIRALSTW